MVGSTVSQVDISHHPDFQAGELVLCQSGWQDYAISDGKGVFRLAPQMKRTRDAGVYSLYGLNGDW